MAKEIGEAYDITFIRRKFYVTIIIRILVVSRKNY